AEVGIRDFHVTGVQTCALPISFQKLILLPSLGPCGILTRILCLPAVRSPRSINTGLVTVAGHQLDLLKSEEDNPEAKFPDTVLEIGRASCRERVKVMVVNKL